MSTTATRIKAIGIICIPTDDVDRAIDFYVGTLGFEKRADIPMGDAYRWVEVAPAGSSTTIAIAPPPPDGSVKAGGMQTGIIFHTGDADALRADLEAAGVDVDAEVSRMGDPVPPMFWLRDPEQNVLMIAEV